MATGITSLDPKPRPNAADLISLFINAVLPITGRWAARYAAEQAAVLRMVFNAFLKSFMLIPVQVVRTGRRLVFRLLAWNPWQAVFLRGFDACRTPLRC